MITLKSEREIKAMQESGELLAGIHVALRDFIKEGVTTKEIDQFVHQKIEEAGAVAAQIGYQDYQFATCTSVNDEILPLGRQNNTFIPYDIRKQMKLNTFTENDSIYAYHFYRLIQRAKNAYFVYDTEADGMGSGEKSRFLAQIKFESNHEVKETFAAPSFVTKPLKEIIVPKTDETIGDLPSAVVDNNDDDCEACKL